jgi:hypothetical protein
MVGFYSVLSLKQTNYLQHILPGGNKNIIFEARQILHILWKPKFEHLVYKKVPSVSLFKTKLIKSTPSYSRQAFSKVVSLFQSF